MIINKNGVYQFESFLQFSTLIHGFSTREYGSLTKETIQTKDAFDNFAEALPLSSSDVVFMDQIHGTNVTEVSESDKGTFVADTDGIFTDKRSVFLCVRIADCIPLLLFDPTLHVSAVVHIGWKGAGHNIVNEILKLMRVSGSSPENLVVGLGPSIRNCCYDIDAERERHFTEQFPVYRDKIITTRDQKTYLNLQKLVSLQLLEKGVREEHIEDSKMCTSDHKNVFFSWREKNEAPFGLFGGVIGIK